MRGLARRLRIVLAAAMTAGLLAPPGAMVGAAQTREPAPWLGTWQLNPDKSTRRAGPSPYRKVTTHIEPSADGVKVTYRMVGTRGGVTRMEWTGRFDGKDYPVEGADTVLTNAYRRLDDRSYAIVVKVDGRTAAVATVRISPDGTTMTVATAEIGPGGQKVNTTAVYDKR